MGAAKCIVRTMHDWDAMQATRDQILIDAEFDPYKDLMSNRKGS